MQKIWLKTRQEFTTPPPPSKDLGYRLRGLDGMRALAALAVLIYHVAPNWMPGGFLGVDVFFVLSGFLITSILIKEKRVLGKIRLRRFWLRRFRRLFPAVTLTVLVTVPLAALVNRDYLVGIFRQVAGSLTFTYNWVNIAFKESYFDRANPQFLSNMWTLAVEQQFYLLWPILLLLIFFLPSRRRWLVPLILVVVGITEMVLLKSLNVDLTRIYQGTDTHSFGMMLGASLALFFPTSLENTAHYLDKKTVRLRGVGAWIGAIGVLISFLIVHDTDPFTYPWSLLAVSFFTLGVIQACLEEVSGVTGGGQVLVELLSWRPLAWLGERSYSLYLWHWPVFILVMGMMPNWPQWFELLIIAVVSITAAHLSYTYVEEPMRRNGIFATLVRWFNLKSLDTAAKRNTAIALAMILSSLPLLGALTTAPDKTSAELLVSKGRDYLKQQAEGKTSPDKKVEKKPDHKTESHSVKKPVKPSAPKPTPVPITGDQVDVIGDSVTLASAPKLAAILPGVNINAEVSRSAAAGINIIKSMRDQGVLRPYVVFSLATNSTFRMQDGEALLNALPAETKLVLVTGFGKPSQQWIVLSNQTMYSLAGANSDRVKVANWDQAIAGHPEMLAGDSVHPQPPGQQMYAQLINSALQQMAPLEPAAN